MPPHSLTLPPRNVSTPVAPADAIEVQEVLVVDDVPEICRLFEGILRRVRGVSFRLQTETNPLRAMELVRSRPYTLVVSDCRMGAADGIDVLRAARQRHPRGRRILMTGYNEIPIGIDRILDARIDAYLQKPFHSQDLLLLLLDFVHGNEEAIERHRLRARELEAMAQREESVLAHARA